MKVHGAAMSRPKHPLHRRVGGIGNRGAGHHHRRVDGPQVLVACGTRALRELPREVCRPFRRLRAAVGQLWWDQSGAGGFQGDFNWLWGMDALYARTHPDEATVARLSFALDQNGEHDRKATVGFGIGFALGTIS